MAARGKRERSVGPVVLVESARERLPRAMEAKAVRAASAVGAAEAAEATRWASRTQAQRLRAKASRSKRERRGWAEPERMQRAKGPTA